MAKSEALIADEYLAELPEDRRESMSVVRQTVLDNLPDGYEECMQYGMIGYVVPLKTYPITYNNQPLAYISLGNQKNYMSLYLMSIYADEEKAKKFDAEYGASGKKMDRGKACVRFKRADDLPLDVIGNAVAGTPVDAFIKMYQKSRRR